MDFERMKRKELQALCKKHGIPANLTNREMAHRLALLLQEDENSTVSHSEIDSAIVANNVKRVKFSPENQTFIFVVSDSDSGSDKDYVSERMTRLRERKYKRKNVMVRKNLVEEKEITEKVGVSTRSQAKSVSVPEEDSELDSLPGNGRKRGKRIVDATETESEPAKPQLRRRKLRNESMAVSGDKILPGEKEKTGFRKVGDRVLSTGLTFDDTAAETALKPENIRNSKQNLAKDKRSGIVPREGIVKVNIGGRATRARTRSSASECEETVKNPTNQPNSLAPEKISEMNDALPEGLRRSRRSRRLFSVKEGAFEAKNPERGANRRKRKPPRKPACAAPRVAEGASREGQKKLRQDPALNEKSSGEVQEPSSNKRLRRSKCFTSKDNNAQLTERTHLGSNSKNSSFPVKEPPGIYVKFPAPEAIDCRTDPDLRFGKEFIRESDVVSPLHMAHDSVSQVSASAKCHDISMVKPTKESVVELFLTEKENSTLEIYLDENEQVGKHDPLCNSLDASNDAIFLGTSSSPTNQVNSEDDGSKPLGVEERLEKNESVICNTVTRCLGSNEVYNHSSASGDEVGESRETENLSEEAGTEECVHAHYDQKTEETNARKEQESDEALSNGLPSVVAMAGNILCNIDGGLVGGVANDVNEPHEDKEHSPEVKLSFFSSSRSPETYSRTGLLQNVSSPHDNRDSKLLVHTAQFTTLEMNTSLSSVERNLENKLDFSAEANTGIDNDDEGRKEVKENVITTEEFDQVFEGQAGKQDHYTTEPDVSKDLISGDCQNSNQQDDVSAIIQEYIDCKTDVDDFVKMGSFGPLTEGKMAIASLEDAETNGVSEPGFDKVFNACGEEDEEAHSTGIKQMDIATEDKDIVAPEMELSKTNDVASIDCTDALSVSHEISETANVNREMMLQFGEVKLGNDVVNMEDSTDLDGRASKHLDYSVFKDGKAANSEGKFGRVGADSNSEAINFLTETKDLGVVPDHVHGEPAEEEVHGQDHDGSNKAGDESLIDGRTCFNNVEDCKQLLEALDSPPKVELSNRSDEKYSTAIQFDASICSPLTGKESECQVCNYSEPGLDKVFNDYGDEALAISIKQTEIEKEDKGMVAAKMELPKTNDCAPADCTDVLSINHEISETTNEIQEIMFQSDGVKFQDHVIDMEDSTELDESASMALDYSALKDGNSTSSEGKVRRVSGDSNSEGIIFLAETKDPIPNLFSDDIHHDVVEEDVHGRNNDVPDTALVSIHGRKAFSTDEAGNETLEGQTCSDDVDDGTQFLGEGLNSSLKVEESCQLEEKNSTAIQFCASIFRPLTGKESESQTCKTCDTSCAEGMELEKKDGGIIARENDLPKQGNKEGGTYQGGSQQREQSLQEAYRIDDVDFLMLNNLFSSSSSKTNAKQTRKDLDFLNSQVLEVPFGASEDATDLEKVLSVMKPEEGDQYPAVSVATTASNVSIRIPPTDSQSGRKMENSTAGCDADVPLFTDFELNLFSGNSKREEFHKIYERRQEENLMSETSEDVKDTSVNISAVSAEQGAHHQSEMVVKTDTPKQNQLVESDERSNEKEGSKPEAIASDESFDFEDTIQVTKNKECSTGASPECKLCDENDAKLAGNYKSSGSEDATSFAMTSTEELIAETPISSKYGLEVPATTMNSASDAPATEVGVSPGKWGLFVVTGDDENIEFQNSVEPTAECQAKQTEIEGMPALIKNDSSNSIFERTTLSDDALVTNVESLDAVSDEPIFGNRGTIINQDIVNFVQLEKCQETTEIDGSSSKHTTEFCGNDLNKGDNAPLTKKIDVEATKRIGVTFELGQENNALANPTLKNYKNVSFPTTPKNLQKAHDMKENLQSAKTKQFGSVAASRKSVNRLPLGDLRF